MSRSELKQWAKDKIKGNIWNLIPAIAVASIITNFSISFANGSYDYWGNPQKTTITLGWIFYFVEVGLTYFMINFITDKKTSFNDIFKYSKDFGRALGVNVLQTIFVFLWSLLLVVPGVIKAFAYSLVPMLLGDEKYNNLSATELLAKSEEMMNGHKMDYFVLQLSFIGWHLLAPFTLFILELWIIPYEKTATTKFLYDIKCEAEGNGSTVNKSNGKFCTNCGSKVEEDVKFCTNCGSEVK